MPIALTDARIVFLVIERLNAAIARGEINARNVAILFIDLDNFKSVNDTLGHETRDNLLKLAAARLQGVVRETDTVGRLGGG